MRLEGSKRFNKDNLIFLSAKVYSHQSRSDFRRKNGIFEKNIPFSFKDVSQRFRKEFARVMRRLKAVLLYFSPSPNRLIYLCYENLLETSSEGNTDSENAITGRI